MSRYNLAPLTTVFTPAPSCGPYIDTTSTFSDGQPSIINDFGWGGTCLRVDGFTATITPDLGCYPLGFDAASVQAATETSDHIALFTPGLVCPSGYSSACTVTKQLGDQPPPTSTTSAIASFLLWEALSFGETAVKCCQTGWHCDDSLVMGCTTDASAASPITVSGTVWDSQCASTISSTTILPSAPFPNAVRYGYQLVVQGPTSASSQSTLEPASTSSQSKLGPISTSSQAEPEATSTSGISEDNSGSGGLSTGAKAAIGVVVPVIVISIAVIGIIVYLRRRRMAGTSQKRLGRVECEANGHSKPELDGASARDVSRHELGANARYELGAGTNDPRTQRGRNSHTYELSDATESVRNGQDDSMGAPPAAVPLSAPRGV